MLQNAHATLGTKEQMSEAWGHRIKLGQGTTPFLHMH